MTKIIQVSGTTTAVLALALLAGGPLLADAPPTANFYLNSPGSGLSYAGVYTSPYTAYINPNSTTPSSGPPVPVICDDFASNSYVYEDWNAYVTLLSSLTSGVTDTYLNWKGASSDGPLNQLQAYQAAAILATQIVQADPGGESGTPDQETAQEELSFALWALFDPDSTDGKANETSGLTPGDTVGGWNLDSGFRSAANNYLNAAVADITNGNISGDTIDSSYNGDSVSTYLNKYIFTIYSYNSALNQPNGPTGCNGNCPPPPQEFITFTNNTGGDGNQTPVPESSSIGEFSVYMLLGGAGLFFVRRRRSPAAN